MTISSNGGRGAIFFLLKVNDQGNREWLETYDNRNGREQGYSIISVNDDGFVAVGQRYQQDSGYLPMNYRFNSQAAIRWQATYEIDGMEEPYRSDFTSVIIDAEDSFIVAGKVNWADSTGYNGIVMKLEAEVLGPMIFEWHPEDTVFSVLPGDTTQFYVRARDQQNNELAYRWLVNENRLGTDTVEIVIFEELGDYLVQCQVSNDAFTSGVNWNVTSEEFYIDSYTPDSLAWTIRRNTEVDFSLGVRAIEDVEPSYAWILTDREHRATGIGDEADMTYTFDLAGNYRLEGVTYYENTEHSVIWEIAVNSVLWWWRPHETEITVEIDEPIEFTALPFNPESDSREYLWLIDGEDDGDIEDRIFARFNDVGEHHVTSIVHDGAEVDTVIWTVTVVEENAVEDDSASLLPTEVTLFPAAPNPFNSTASIRYFLPRSADVRLTVYDSAGRLVRVLS